MVVLQRKMHFTTIQNIVTDKAFLKYSQKVHYYISCPFIAKFPEEVKDEHSKDSD